MPPPTAPAVRHRHVGLIVSLRNADSQAALCRSLLDVGDSGSGPFTRKIIGSSICRTHNRTCAVWTSERRPAAARGEQDRSDGRGEPHRLRVMCRDAGAHGSRMLFLEHRTSLKGLSI